MRVKVDEIPEEGLEISEKIEPQKISVDLIEQYIEFIRPIDAKAIITKSGREVFVNLTLEAPVEYTCARCLSKIEDTLKKKFDVIHEVNEGDILELDEEIRQEIMLDYPIKVVCKVDCRGLCPNCGQNLNVAECECDKR